MMLEGAGRGRGMVTGVVVGFCGKMWRKQRRRDPFHKLVSMIHESMS